MGGHGRDGGAVPHATHLDADRKRTRWAETVIFGFEAAFAASPLYLIGRSELQMCRGIERFHNLTRRHSTIGYVSSVEFERKVGLA